MNGRDIAEEKKDSVGDAFTSATNVQIAHPVGTLGDVLSKLNTFRDAFSMLEQTNPVQATLVKNRLTQMFQEVSTVPISLSDSRMYFDEKTVDKFAGLLYLLGSTPENKRLAYVQNMHNHLNEFSQIIVAPDFLNRTPIDKLTTVLTLFHTDNQSARLAVIDLLHDEKRHVSLSQIVTNVVDLMQLLDCFSINNRMLIMNKLKDHVPKWFSSKELFEVFLIIFFNENHAAELRANFTLFPPIASLDTLCDAINAFKFNDGRDTVRQELIFSMVGKTSLRRLVNSGSAFAQVCGLNLSYRALLCSLECRSLSEIPLDVEDACKLLEIAHDSAMQETMVLDLTDWLVSRVESADDLANLHAVILYDNIFQTLLQALNQTINQRIKTVSDLNLFLTSVGRENHGLLLSIVSKQLSFLIRTRTDFDAVYLILNDDVRTRLIDALKDQLEKIIPDVEYRKKLLAFYGVEVANKSSGWFSWWQVKPTATPSMQSAPSSPLLLPKAQ